MIYLVLYIFFILFFLKDYHKAVIIYAPLRMFLHSGICLKFESPNITLDFACCIIFLILFLLKNKRSFPKTLLRGYIALFVSYFIAIFASTYSLLQVAPRMIGQAITLFYSFIFLCELKKMEDVKLFHKAFYVCILVMVTYGLFEYVTQINPVIDFEKTFIPEDDNGKIYFSGERYGSVRCQSMMAISISYGALCVIWLCVAMSFRKIYKEIVPSFFLPFFWGLILIATFSTGSKSPFIFLVTYLVSFFFMVSGYVRIKAALLLGVLLFIFVFQNFISDFILQITDSSQTTTAGSDIPMRIMQVTAAANLLDQYGWLFGLGARGVMKANTLAAEELLGAESIWLQLLLEYGIVGCFTYVYMLYSVNKYKKEVIGKRGYTIPLVLIISWVVLNTVTSLPGIDLTFFLCIIYAAIMEKRYKIKEFAL